MYLCLENLSEQGELSESSAAELTDLNGRNNLSLLYFSVYKKTYMGGKADPSEAERLGNVGVGSKENSGFSANHDRFIQTSDNPARFITHYQTRYV